MKIMQGRTTGNDEPGADYPVAFRVAAGAHTWLTQAIGASVSKYGSGRLAGLVPPSDR